MSWTSGCGTGSLTLALAAAGVAAAVGIDPSGPYVEFARTRTAGPVVRFDMGDGTMLPCLPHRLQGEPRPRTAHLAPEAGSG
jgi:ubiquinone/menaquinone biosynthesis C-methylase UbiE